MIDAALVGRFPQCRVAVVGDLMLDEYVWGRVNRISPEAPVPVILTDRYSCCPGGAANTARNLVTLGGHCRVFGVVGNDPAGREISDSLRETGVEISEIVVDPSRRTTAKRRIVAGTQQLLRVDSEDTFDLTEPLRTRLCDAVVRAIEADEIDAVIFEDYGKGVLSSAMLACVIGAARAHGVFTALDPKPGRLKPVPGLTFLKPNRSEALLMTGLDEHAPLEKVAAAALAYWKPEYLLISLSSDGLALCVPGSPPTVIPTVAREVFDVSGAGDTLTAAFTLALCAGATPTDAARLANAAAGIVVAKLGTAAVSAAELCKKLEENQ